MAKRKKTSTPDWKQKRFAGKKVVLAGKSWFNRAKAKEFFEGEGATVAKAVTADTDYLILNHDADGNSTAEMRAAQLNSAGKASITELTIDQLEHFVRPDGEETLAMLQAGKNGCERLRWLTGGSEAFTYYCGFDHAWLDLSGAKLSDVKLTNIDLTFAELDGADFRRSELEDVSLRKSTGIRFDEATLKDVITPSLTDCSFKKARLIGTLDDGTYFNCDFRGAVLESGEMQSWAFRRFHAKDCNFARADLKGIELESAVIEGCNLQGADLSGADCRGASFKDCDLRKAKLVGAELAAADFTGARLDGADFRDASVGSAKLDERAAKKAKNLNLDSTVAPGKVGPKLKELKSVVDQAKQVDVTLTVSTTTGEQEIGFLTYGSGHSYARPEIHLASWTRQPSFTKLLLELASQYRGEPMFDTLKVSGTKSPVKGRELKQLVQAAWCEAFGIEEPSDEELAKRVAKKKSNQATKRAELVELLKSGPKGVQQWNSMDAPQTRAGGKYKNEDFSGANLEGWETYGAEFDACDFTKAKLKGAHLYGKFNKSNFAGADLRNAELHHGRFTDVDFTGAKLSGASLQSTFLRRADFTKANLKKCDLSCADLRGANLSSVDISSTNLEYATYDDKTQLPEGFVHRDEMQWKGPGTPPGLAAAIKAARPKGPIDLATFMERIQERVDKARLDKALKMLKADRFQLFADVQDDHLVGVVKSQSDPDLVYSSRLDAEGMFACCTQNLNMCGGLRGAPCKHLLVLIIGLAQSDRVDPTTVDEWLDASRLVAKPVLDKDAMSETLLRYKGAEAGEVDWRPTETVPEDYYAF